MQNTLGSGSIARSIFSYGASGITKSAQSCNELKVKTIILTPHKYYREQVGESNRQSNAYYRSLKSNLR